jgi:hypothetical protein
MKNTLLVILLACGLLSVKSQASFFDKLKDAADSYNKNVSELNAKVAPQKAGQQNVQQQNVQQQKAEKVTIPEFSSLGEKKQWLDSQKDILDEEYKKYVVDFFATADKLAVGLNDTLASIEIKSKNAEALIQNANDSYSKLNNDLRKLKKKNDILYEGRSSLRDRVSSNSFASKNYITCMLGNYTFSRVTPFEALYNCEDQMALRQVDAYKKYLQNAYNFIDDYNKNK